MTDIELTADQENLSDWLRRQDIPFLCGARNPDGDRCAFTDHYDEQHSWRV